MWDPGKRVDAHLTTKQWKALKLAADARGITLKMAAHEALCDWAEREVTSDKCENSEQGP